MQRHRFGTETQHEHTNTEKEEGMELEREKYVNTVELMMDKLSLACEMREIARGEEGLVFDIIQDILENTERELDEIKLKTHAETKVPAAILRMAEAA